MTITELKEKILSGYRITRNDELTIFKICDFMELCQAADEIREKFSGNQVELCSIINGKSGHCSENCRFCAQSAFNKTDCETYDFIEDEKIVARAVQDANEGVHRFAIVTSGRSLSGADFEKAINVYKKMSSTLKMNFCASFGFLTKDQLLRLKDAGVTRYHHNIETSRRNFPNICTSHTFDMKLETIKTVKEIGMKICSGGIIGMGETFEDRIDMALTLSEAGVDSIPINALMPIKGTPFENIQQLSEDEILRTIAMFRFINPQSTIRLAAGRKLLSNSGEKAFNAGANAMITGNMLTTSGTTIAGDISLMKKMGRKV
ncbi:biotin synthase BioB [Treponema sp.]|uniref:biotin synthase BioB n=1 Tax=Treponema sp. TaxID=166 RepID=UPI00298DCBDD|nr:biotin synthase BioB [Treponema sp.]